MFSLVRYGLSLLLGAGIASLLVYHYEQGQIAELMLRDAQFAVNASEQARTTQKKQDQITLNSAVKEAAAQQKIVTKIVTLTKEIPIRVPRTTVCIPLGLVRVINAAARPGTDPDSISPGKSDESCSPISWRSLAADLIDDYGSANQNSEQLTALQDWLKAQEAVKPAP